MKTRYHINKITNKVGQCKASSPERCPVSEAGNHYETKSEATTANEKELSETYSNNSTLKKNTNKLPSLQLSEKIFTHPKGYEFSELMNKAKDETERAHILKDFDYGTVDKSLIVGEKSKDIEKSIREEMSENIYNAEHLPVEYNVRVIEANNGHSVYLYDEDQLFIAASHNVEENDAYDAARDMYNESLNK